MLDQISNDLITSPVQRWSDTPAYRAASERPAIRSILIVKVDHIGDFFLGLDAMAALRRAFPRARIDLVCAPWNEDWARSLDLFDDVCTLTFFDKRADGAHPCHQPGIADHLPDRHYDLAIDLRCDPDTRGLLRYVSATYRAGFESDGENDILTICLPHRLPRPYDGNIGMHQSMLLLRLARAAIDLFTPNPDVRRLLLGRVSQPHGLDLSAAIGRILVVCNTSSGRAIKNWPAERFARLVRWLAVDLEAIVVLVGGNDQAEEARDIMRLCASPNVVSAVGRTSMRQAVSLVSQASLFVGNDSGLTHIAGRLGVPTVALFSGIDPTVMWAALGREVTILRAPVPCSPCHLLAFDACHHDHACMRNLSEGRVRAAVRERLLTALRFTGASPSAPLPDLRAVGEYEQWAMSGSVQTPQRYGDNHARYRAAGGRLDIASMMQGFVAGSSGNRGDLNRFFTLALIFDQIIKEQIEGDMAELGVYQGNTASMLAMLARQVGCTVHLLDTFTGFDERQMSGIDAGKRMEFADTSLEQVRSRVGEANVHYVQGLFPDTAEQLPQDARFSLVHIDCDLYIPFKQALAYFYNRLVPGGFLVMHDYASLHWDGAERAVDEFFADKPESPVPVADGSGTVVVRRARAATMAANWRKAAQTTGFANAWVAASLASTGDMLASGWDAPEPWGVWGLGGSHVLSLELLRWPVESLELAVESSVVLYAGRTTAEVDVFAAGRHVARWSYDSACNLAVRLAIVPRDLFAERGGLPWVDIEFRPSRTEPPHALDPSNPDDRPLGMGLIRFRQRPR